MFYGSGEEMLPGIVGAAWSQVGNDQYRLSGTTNTLVPGVPYTIFVYVSDRYYSTVARLSLRFTVVESLRGEITTAVSRSSDNSALLSITNNNVYDVTEGGACSRLRAHFSAS